MPKTSIIISSVPYQFQIDEGYTVSFVSQHPDDYEMSFNTAKGVLKYLRTKIQSWFIASLITYKYNCGQCDMYQSTIINSQVFNSTTEDGIIEFIKLLKKYPTTYDRDYRFKFNEYYNNDDDENVDENEYDTSDDEDEEEEEEEEDKDDEENKENEKEDKEDDDKDNDNIYRYAIEIPLTDKNAYKKILKALPKLLPDNKIIENDVTSNSGWYITKKYHIELDDNIAFISFVDLNIQFINSIMYPICKALIIKHHHFIITDRETDEEINSKSLL